MTWLGEYKLGDRLPLQLWVRSSDAPTLPDAPPRAIVMSSAGDQIQSKLLPIHDTKSTTALFLSEICLDGKYATGAHVVQFLYTISSVVMSELHRFNITAGGNVNGTGMAMEYFSVSPNEFLLVQNDNGSLIRLRNPVIS